MAAKGITKRWLLNSLGVILIIMITLIATLSLVVQGYIYNGIQQVINGRSDELTNVFSDYGRRSPAEFNAVARKYVEDFPNKEKMELMVFNSSGDIIITSIGFEPDESQQMPDYTAALASKEDYGTWTGKLSSGEKVMAVTRVIRNNMGSFVGAVRYVVSLQQADRQVFTIVSILILAGLLIVFFIVISSYYFMKSILYRISAKLPSGLPRGILRLELKKRTMTRSASCAIRSTRWQWNSAHRKK